METLVLTSGWEPLQVVPWQRAVTLLFLDKVEVVEEYRDHAIRTVTMSWPMPAVVRSLRARYVRARGVKFSRQNVYLRDAGRCQYCGRAIPRHEATWDHVQPRSRGGRTGWENIVLACVECNRRKASRTPAEARMTLRSKPVKPRATTASAFTVTVAHRAGRMNGAPPEWRQFLVDTGYWYGRLDEG